MKAQELRIGNYFLGYDKVEFQWGVEHFNLMSKGIEPDEIGIPIPLTEEWLLGFGFDDDLKLRVLNTDLYLQGDCAESVLTHGVYMSTDIVMGLIAIQTRA